MTGLTGLDLTFQAFVNIKQRQKAISIVDLDFRRYLQKYNICRYIMSVRNLSGDRFTNILINGSLNNRNIIHLQMFSNV